MAQQTIVEVQLNRLSNPEPTNYLSRYQETRDNILNVY
jgi:hypothetical protein